MSLEDRRLAQRMLAGEEAAFQEFFGTHFPPLFRFACARMGHDGDAAEDVVQATLCRAISRLRTYRGEAPLLTWLCTFCRHEISAHFARLGRSPVTTALAEDDPEILAALDSLWTVAGDGPEDALGRREIARLVHVALDRLPARHADALEWKYVDGLSVKEIAERLCVSPKAAESLLTRARGMLRDGLLALAAP